MTSKNCFSIKNSFISAMGENIRHRYWVIIISILTFLFLYPVWTNLQISMEKSYQDESRSMEMVILDAYRGAFSLKTAIMFVTAVFAAALASEGFYYLF